MTNYALILLLIVFPSLALSMNNKEDFNYTYYPKLDSDSAYELHVIKRHYYRYSNKLKILADTKIKEIKETILNANKINDE